MYLSILCPTTPSRAIKGKGGVFDSDLTPKIVPYVGNLITHYTHVQKYEHYQSNSVVNLHLLGGEKVRIWLTGMSCGWCIWILYNSNPHPSPIWPRIGVVEHNIDRCIMVISQNKYDVLAITGDLRPCRGQVLITRYHMNEWCIICLSPTKLVCLY